MTIAFNDTILNLGLGEAIDPPTPTKVERWKNWLDEGGNLPPMEETQAAMDRAGEWHSSFKPFNSFEMFLTLQAATHALRVERCQHHERALRSLQIMRAVRRWDADRRNAVEDLATRLKGQPSVVARKLASTKHGCEWLIECWEGLQLALQTPEGWEEPQLNLALDLLGTRGELRKVAPVANPDRRAEVVRAEIDRLRALKAEGLDELDAFERAAAEAGVAPDDAPIAQLKRYERACAIRMEWAHSQLKKGRHDFHPEGPNPGRHTPPAPNTTTTTTARGPAPSDEGQYRADLRARIALRDAQAEAEAPAPLAVTATPPQVAPSDPADSGRPDAITTHPEFVALSALDRIQTLLTGVVAQAAPAPVAAPAPAPAAPKGNRRHRRAQKARMRRQG